MNALSARTRNIVVIGAGLGGMSAAVHLAAAGHSVEIYEKNDRIGGKLNLLRKDGFSFDLGPSILTLPHFFEEIFAAAGRRMADYVTIREVQPHWRNFFEDGTTLDLSPDARVMEQELAKLPLDERSGFYRFLEYSRSQYQVIDEGYFARGYDTLGEVIAGYGPLACLRRIDFLGTMHGRIARYVRNTKLQDVLSYFAKYIGASPYDAPALLNLLPYAQFGHGLWYVDGGMYGIAAGLQRLMAELGITVHLDSEVAEITTAGTRVTGIRTKDGRQATADVIVSNMEVIPAYTALLHEPPSFLRRYRRFGPACSGLVLHLGVDTTYPQLAHHNFFFSRNPRRNMDQVFHRQELPDDPTIYLVAPARTDPACAPAGCDVIKVLPHIPPLREDHPFTDADYAALRDRVLDKLERMGLQNLRQHIVVEDRWTPVDIQARYLSNRGAIYGVASDRWQNLGFKAPKRSEKYANLFFVGGSVNPGGGMPMAVLSGRNAARLIQTDISAAAPVGD
jgi:diapolycopene oxygenase